MPVKLRLGVGDSLSRGKIQLAAVWSGRASITTMVVWFPFFVLGMLAIAMVTFLAMEESQWIDRPKALLLNLMGFSLAIVGACIWIVGSLRSTSNRLAENQFIRAGLMTLLGLSGILIVLTEWLPTYKEIWGAYRAEATVPKPPKARKPWTVTAVVEVKRVIAQGPIGQGSAEALKTVLDRNPHIRLVELDSPGGYINEGRLIEAMVRLRKLDTVVLGSCESACTDIFLAGNNRFSEPTAVFGFHQSGYAGRPHDTQWDFREYETSIGYRQHDLPEDFIDKALNTSFYSMWHPQTLDLKKNGFVTEWWTNRPDKYR